MPSTTHGAHRPVPTTTTTALCLYSYRRTRPSYRILPEEHNSQKRSDRPCSIRKPVDRRPFPALDRVLS
ncbi:hypothetical protein CGCF413_v001679 [Colletotrichum fructicola]|nr:hypothetical protein CGCF413_v001679 [Colletotrichum fructicola]